MNFDHAICFDVESFPNTFTMNVLGLFSDLDLTFEISQFRDDRVLLLQWFRYWHEHQIPMIGFNSLFYDYPLIHEIWLDPYISEWEIYDHSKRILTSLSRFGGIVWESDRFAPQIDLFRVHHFDNHAKTTSLKALEINMRSDNVMECPLPFDTPLTKEQIDGLLIPYNKHDVRETKQFAHFSMDALRFRLGLRSTLHGDVMNFNDTKIGAKILEQRLGDDLCYDRDLDGRRTPRQTFRNSIPLNEIIFPYIEFRNPEFNRVLAWMRTQTISADETKGVFTGVSANVGGLEFHFGTGGIHGSVTSQRFAADAEFAIVDIDVAGLYPNIAIQNKLYPEHLGERFVQEYAQLPVERAKHAKGTVENAAYKLASNGTYGNSNNQYSVFYDPKFTMTITINGQLMLCMLAEWLLSVPTLQILMANTDGLTYRVHRSQIPHAEIVRRVWERKTKLVLEETRYSRMWIRDVNSYIAEYEE